MARRQIDSPALMLPLWDVFGSTLVTTSGHYVRAFRIRGLDSEHAPSGLLEATATSLYRDMIVQLPESMFVQVLMQSHSNYDDLFEQFEKVEPPAHPILAMQRERRLAYLKGLNLRRHSVYAFVGSVDGLAKKQFARVGRATHSKKLEELDELSRAAVSMFEQAGLPATELAERQILDLYWQMLNPGSERPKREEDPGRNGLQANKTGYFQSIREQLVQSEWLWDADYLRIGDTYHQTLTLRDLPPETVFTDAEQWYSLGFDFWVSVTLSIPRQGMQRAALTQRRRMAQALTGTDRGVTDYQRSVKQEEQEELAELIARTGQRLIRTCCQAVIKAPKISELKRHVRAFNERARSKQYGFYSERAAHDHQFLHTLPGMGVLSRRNLLVTSTNAVDSLPVFKEDNGDVDPVLILRTARDELFSFNPFEEARDNWNFTVFGASGAGKSVFINLLIVCCVLAHRTRGQVMVVDFAGEEKSSYLMISKLFGGEFIPVLSEKSGLNPFPTPAKALGEGKIILPQVESFLTTVTDLLLSNTEQGKDSRLYRNIIQRGIRGLYQRDSEVAPTYIDLLGQLKAFRSTEDVDQDRLRVLIELLSGFLDSPTSRLFTRQSKASPDSPFLILDLHGIDSLPEEIREAVAFVTTGWCKQVAFNPQNPGYKYIFLDELAQQIKQRRLLDLVDELYSTARKHLTSVGTITQMYRTLRDSPLSSTVKTNSTTQIFLSHAKDSEARELIAADYGLSDREMHLFGNLRTVKGKYSQALIRTEVRNPETRDKEMISSVLKVELSPFDYQLCTSDAKDREQQRRFVAANPDRPLHEVLGHLASKGRPS